MMVPTTDSPLKALARQRTPFVTEWNDLSASPPQPSTPPAVPGQGEQQDEPDTPSPLQALARNRRPNLPIVN
jgi:hypothetical protein